MKKEDIPFYSDPYDFEGGGNKFPCDTEYMVYNPMLHRYYLTASGLQKYGIQAERMYSSTNPNKIQELIEKTSKKVYDYIQYKAGRNCYQIMMYRIATAPPTIYPDQYFMRKQFEEALAEQARFIVESGDKNRYSGADIEQPSQNEQNENVNEFKDMSIETIRTLDTLGLTRWFKTSQFTFLDLTKY